MNHILLNKQLQSFVRESTKTITGSFLLSLLILPLLINIGFTPVEIITWLSLQSLVSLTRLYHNNKLRKKLALDNFIISNNTLYISYCLLTCAGILWGIIFFTGIEKASGSYDFLILAIAIGFVSSAILSTAAYLKLYFALNAPIIIMTLLAIVLGETDVHTIAFTLAILGFSYIIISAVNYSNHFSQNVLRENDLIKSKNEIVGALSRAGEFRDEDTGHHVLRMANTCYLMAQKVGYCEEDALLIRNASAMHDVGKIGIPDYILLKSERLSDDEFSIMKKHTAIGKYILGTSNSETKLISMSKSIAYSHHEKWDGSGYPDGLAGKDIPLEARIATISDVFDALTSERPYKKAWAEEDAVNFMKEHSGTRFDPELIQVFLKLLPEIQAYRTINN